MPAFLVSIAKWFVALLVEQIFTRVKAYVETKKAEKEEREKRKAEIQKEVDELKAAKTQKEIDEAAKKLLDNF